MIDPIRQSGCIGWAALVAIIAAIPIGAPAQEVDDRTGRELRRREVVGDALSTEEKAKLARWIEARRIRSEPARAAYRSEHPPRKSTGMRPITELGPQTYRGHEGGLYPDGKNIPPKSHLRHGLALAAQVVPRNADGHIDANGKIVLLSIGMSNTTMEFQAFRQLVESRSDLNPALVFVDGAQGSRGSPHTANPESSYWSVVDQRLNEAGVNPAQVQAVWIKQVKANPRGGFPDHAVTLQAQLAAAMNILADRYPNLKLAYLSSRVYAGYAEKRLHPEPYAYETAFAVKWLIRDQINGREHLNCDPARGPVRSPWLAWGPYLWADGVTPRDDGLVYARADFEFDGIHPSRHGRRKVGEQLLAFFTTDVTTRPWFVAKTSQQ